MGAYKIEAYIGNTLKVTCPITGIASIDGFAATMVVKATKDDDAEALIEVEGEIEGLSAEFIISSEENSLAAGKRYYEINLDKDAEHYTIRQDEYVLEKSMKYSPSN